MSALRQQPGAVALVGGPCDPGTVQVTARHIERIPPGNLRVPRGEFAAVWAAAERACEAQTANPAIGHVWYEVGVMGTCRWMATAIVPGLRQRGWQPARAPVSSRTNAAHEELIEYELVAAEKLAARQPSWLQDQQGWIEGVVATLNWAWRGVGDPPIVARRADAG